MVCSVRTPKGYDPGRNSFFLKGEGILPLVRQTTELSIILPLRRQTKIAAGDMLIFLFYLSMKIRLDFSCESSA